jgi:hypothetical protein
MITVIDMSIDPDDEFVALDMAIDDSDDAKLDGKIEGLKVRSWYS